VPPILGAGESRADNKELKMRFRCFGTILGLLLMMGPLCNAPAQVRISEFMASNTSTLADEDGSFEDWIEIQNISPTPVNLLNWSLTDNAGNLTKWKFPATNLPPGQFLVVFASDKNRRTPGAHLHTNFKLSAGGEYLGLVAPNGSTVVSQFAPQFPGQLPDVSYGVASVANNVTLVATGATAHVLIPSSANGGDNLGYTWTGAAANEPFSTSGWISGVTGVGFGVVEVGLNVQSTMSNQNASAFLRLPFVLANATNFSQLTLRLKYNDGFIAWINGIEIARANAPEEDLSWDSTATQPHNATLWETMTFGLSTNLFRAGTNILAIQGLNLSAADGSFLINPELIATTLANDSPGGVYFTQPTPGAENLGGNLLPGPGITEPTHIPLTPLANENVAVTARIFPTANPVVSATLFYRVMFGPENSVAMYDDGAHGDGAAGDGIYGATIPAGVAGTGEMIRYYIKAQDNTGRDSRLPVFSDPAETAEYFGTVVDPDYVGSTLPVIHLFAPPSVLQPGPSTSQIGADSEGGGRVALFYDGEFYDNVLMSLRGNSTAGYNKKSHRLDFNREHPFRHNESTTRIRKTSFVADYPDPTYLRQGLSFWLCNELGVVGPFYAPYRLQLNGQFYQLANHSDVQSDEHLKRLGYDPNGALYKAAGTIVPSGFSTGGFEKKTRKWEDNADYVAFANAISESLSTGQRFTNLLDRLDLPQVISYMVAARFAHENDDAWANMSIYHDNDGDDLWRIIPFDMNLSWGAAFMDSGDYSGIQVTNDNIKSFPLYGSSQAVPASGGSAWNRLYDAIFTVPQTREMFLRRMRTVLDAYVLPPGSITADSPIYQKVIQWRDRIATEASLDRSWWGWPGKGGQCNFDPGINLNDGVNSLLTDFLAKRRLHFYGKHSVTNTTLPMGISKTQNAGIPLAQPANATLSIVGWDYNPASGNQNEEYLQLRNDHAYAVDISDWILSGGIRFQFAKGTVVPANSSIYVSPDVKAFRQRATNPRGGQGRFVVGPYQGRLNAWGESLTLTNAAGQLVASNSFVGNPSPAQRFLRITEIMYNPLPAPLLTGDAQQFEYLELQNTSSDTTLNLNGVSFTRGIAFNFTGSSVTTLLPGQTVLVVRNTALFTARYGSGFNIAGQFDGALDNAGETLRLEDASGEKILEFAYNDSWYPLTDGLGFSLVIVDAQADWKTWDNKTSWRASGAFNGSPGLGVDPAPAVVPPILVNEVLTHTDPPLLDSVELFNPTSTNVNVGGWFLTDSFLAPTKYRIPSGVQIPAGSYLVFDENQFAIGATGFRFSELGESVYLFSGDANTNLTGYYHGYDFPAAPNGVSFGRHTNSEGAVQFVLQSRRTLGAANAYPQVGPVVISEIMYHPPGVGDDEASEFLELQNIVSTNVPLYDPAFPTNAWQVRNAVEFNFPGNQTLTAGQRLLLVGFDPADSAQLAAFRAQYGVSNTVPVYGPWSGRLSNSGETIELLAPGKPDAGNHVPYYLVDQVSYRDAAPWPAEADGLGNSLQRVDNFGFGNDPTNWFAAGVTAGRATLPNQPPVATITAPGSGALVGVSNLLVLVQASDPDGSVASVELLVNGAVISQRTNAPFEFNWTNLASGNYTLQARVTDDLGAIRLSPAVELNLSGLPPSVAFTSPANGAIVLSGATVNLAVTPQSGSGTATSVSYFLDGELLATVGAPFSYTWTANPAGAHTLTAVAQDGDGDTSVPASCSIFVQAVASNPVLIAANSTWRYLDNGTDQGTAWIQPAFNDATWSSGDGKFGFNSSGNGGFGTILSYGGNPNNRYVTYYFRRQFVVPTLAGMTNLFLEVQRDDGVAVYLNGNSLYRNNLPSGPLSHTLLATNATDNGNSWHTAVLPLTGLVAGTNTLAVELHQSSVRSSDLVFDLRLRLEGYTLGPAILSHPTSVTIAPGDTTSFNLFATGSGPLSYRWYFNDTLQHSTSNTLTVVNAQPENVGEYFAVVSNALGVAVSRVATLNLTVLDSDGDGMPDDWELANGTNPYLNDANADPDGDGMTNLQEFWAGTSPTNAASALRFENMALDGLNLRFSFQAMSNRSYSIQSRTVWNSGWLPWQDISAAATNRQLWITNPVSGAQRFYRLVTPAQP